MLAAGSHTIWLTPVIASSGILIRKTDELETLLGSIAPVKGIEIRGWTLNPSSVSRTVTSAQSLGRVVRSGFGRSTRSPVTCDESGTV